MLMPKSGTRCLPRALSLLPSRPVVLFSPSSFSSLLGDFNAGCTRFRLGLLENDAAPARRARRLLVWPPVSAAASCSSSRSLILYDCPGGEAPNTLLEHERGVALLGLSRRSFIHRRRTPNATLGSLR
ncbi:hypothetical protein BDZ89DRAFT_540914 [Hymenopellis radicata]|nr:hypothetical protein BDZ89DRAFT_540914 [Hymenopellis radicata]